MATDPNDAAFLQKYGNYKPAPANVPVRAIKPIIGGETPEEAAARRAEEARQQQAAGFAAESAGKSRREEVRGAANQLRDEFNGIEPVTSYKKALPNYVAALKTDDTGTGDLALVYYFAKTIDPGSAVQQGEMDNIQTTDARLPAFAQNALRELRLSNGKFTDAAREGLRRELRGIVEQRKAAYLDERDRYMELSKSPEYNVNPNIVVGATPFGERYNEEIQSYWKAKEEAPVAVPEVSAIRAGETFQTEQDLAAQRALQEAWNRGATAEEIAQIAAQYNQRISPQDLEWFKANPGKPRSFYVTPTGQPTEAQGIIGAALETPVGEAVGGYTLGAANALTAGFLDELAPILGLDPGRVQAAKDYLRTKAPVSSFVGEATGGVAAALPFVSGVRALTAGTQLAPEAAALLGEAAYGATYGAGESPEGQRALGALIGGGAGLAGGALANRFMPGGPGTFSGVTPEAPAGTIAPEVPPMAAMAPEAPSIAPEAPPMATVAPSPAPAAPVEAAPAPTPEMAAELGTIIREASGTGVKAKGAQTKLAEMAQINPEAKAAAERLGIEVPADVFSDNPQVRAAIGLTRSLAGGEAEAAWRNAVATAVDQADNIMRDFDAQFIEGAVSPGVVSQRVKDSLTKTRADLNAEATAIYKRVDESVPKQTPVQMDNLFRELTAIAGEVGESGMTAQEKRLMGLIQSGEVGGGDITYGRLIREKNLIGKALKREESPYGSLDEATLKRLYAALATDQLDNVGRIGGEELRSELRGANLIYAKERALGERIINAFGRDLEGGIANKMRSAITGAAKGDPGEFARLMKAVPADLRKEVVATALTSATRSARGAEKGGFGFSEFADLYPKLRANPQVYKQIVETLGPKASDTLRDLFEVSKRITEARANVLTTGKANQALVESLNAEGIIAKIMDSTTAKRAVGAMAGLGGPVTGAVMPDIMQAMSKGNPDAVRAAGKMFASPEFQAVLTEAATQPEVTDRAINRVASSQRFRDFAKTIGLEFKQGRNWLRSIATAGAVQETSPEPGPPPGAIVVGPQQ